MIIFLNFIRCIQEKDAIAGFDLLQSIFIELTIAYHVIF